MARQVVFLVCTAIVCFWTFQPIMLVLCMTVPEDKPVLFPEDEIESNQHEAWSISSPSEGSTTAAPETDSTSFGIPDKLLIQLSKVQDYAELLDFLGTNGSGIGDGIIELNGTVTRRKLSGTDLSRTAGCEPELQTVELDRPKDTTNVYWPMCVRVLRCGGCCTSSLLSCVPTKMAKIDAKVLHAHYTAQDVGGEFEVMGFKTLAVEKHLKCTCRCKEQPEDCTEHQVYKEEECKCVCKNKDGMEKCTERNKIWNPRECVCKCQQKEECSTGFSYNNQSCRCEAGRSSLIGRRLPKTNIVNGTLAPDSVEPASDGDSPTSDSDLPTTAEIPSTTTTKRPLQRGRKARPPSGQRV